MMTAKSISHIFPFLKDGKFFDNAESAVLYSQEIYKKSEEKIKHAFDALMSGSDTEKIECAIDGCYPFIGICVDRENLNEEGYTKSYGILHAPGIYGTTIADPFLFQKYYEEQISHLINHYNVPVIVGLSDVAIPLPYVVENAAIQNDKNITKLIKKYFALPNLRRINDSIANSFKSVEIINPLALFSGERVDYSLHRLQHYTGTSAEHFQSFVLLTNYQRYIKTFIEYAKKIIKEDDNYTEIVVPENISITREELLHSDGEMKLITPDHLPQMPAYHLKRKDGSGITFVNIGVGPSNAKTITDHMAVLRPNVWIMVGHCAGLRSTQVLGDYVLAHGYVRDDHVLDQDVPFWVPIPPIAEVQVAIQEAIQFLDKDEPLRTQIRTGTVFTTDDRNWELRSTDIFQRIQQSRAIAVDMESATIATNGFRFRVPYGTILCVSDKPIHEEIKMKGMANEFYRNRVKQHLEVSLKTIDILRESGAENLHSRKLRGFEDPPFR